MDVQRKVFEDDTNLGRELACDGVQVRRRECAVGALKVGKDGQGYGSVGRASCGCSLRLDLDRFWRDSQFRVDQRFERSQILGADDPSSIDEESGGSRNPERARLRIVAV